jgi:hypothetical protein
VLQLDAIKAHRSAAKAFSAAVDRRNAELLQHSSKTSSSAADAPTALKGQQSQVRCV